MKVTLRPADASDLPFLADMLAEAAYWRSGGPPPDDDVLNLPDMARYLQGWPLPGDVGVVAEDGAPVGAAWLRFLPETEPGYGFVDARTPELTIGVVASRRGEGVGRRLLVGLLDAARDAGVEQVSLSVEPDNPAMRLCESVGFVPVGVNGGAVTMLRPVGERRP